MTVIETVKRAAGKGKKPVSFAKRVVVETPRNITTQAEKPVFTIGGKIRSNEFKKIRGVIGKLFQDAGLNSEWMKAVKENKIGNSNIAVEQFKPYDEEFKRLHVAVQDTFSNAGRPELAKEFVTTVPVYTSSAHPVDFIATLLKGASSKVAEAATDNQYKVLAPFKKMMQEVLTSKGIAAPNSMADLTQVFYNNFVAGKDTGLEKMNFDTMQPADQYHADEAVVNAVVTYVKTLADKKASGETLSKTQDKIATLGLNVQNQLTNVATEEVNKNVGEAVISNSKPIMFAVIAAVVLVIWLVVKK